MTHRHPSQPPPSRTEADVSYVYAMVADVYTLRTGLHSMKVSGVLTRVQEEDRDTLARALERLVKEIRG